MPKSSRNGKQAIIKWLETSRDIKTILDIGAGKGTYKRLCDGFAVYKDVPAILPILQDSHWTAVEVWQPYIDEYELEFLYDTVIKDDIREIQKQLGNYDLAILGDVLEHMSKEDAVKLITTLSKKCKSILVSIPLGYSPQDEHNDNPFERHVKDDWSHEEFISTFLNIKKFQIDDDIGVYWIEK